VRHVLYGNKYFRKNFGVASDEYMLPDCFGFPAALPSALAHCGVKGFSTQKLTWNASSASRSRSASGTARRQRVVAALDPGVRRRECAAISQGRRLEGAHRQQRQGPACSPTTTTTAPGTKAARPTEPRSRWSQESSRHRRTGQGRLEPADWLFDAITPDSARSSPYYQGELELTEHSAGSVTSQAYMKRWNRKNEL
jgi:alpha-mannosidase